MISNVFITGTDTGVGKTWVSAAAIRSLLRRGISAKALKPVACGLDGGGRNDDIEVLLAAQNLHHADQINRYRFALPAAPSQAAAAEGVVVDPSVLVQWCHDQSNGVETCLIEGVGGLMTPITDSWLVSDWIETMPDYGVWLVVGCKLGAINQTLLTLAKLKQMSRSPSRIFFNAVSADNNAWIESTRQAIAPFLANACVSSSIRYGEQASISV
ncbi:MAG: dethiobiotin synthase [Mariprofundus sp.]|nr:dethiobiotin synthase [Mariprofundus sp.]